MAKYRKAAAPQSPSMRELIRRVTGGRQLLQAGLVVLIAAAWLAMARFPQVGHVPLEVLIVDTSASSRLSNADADTWLSSGTQMWLDDSQGRQAIGSPEADHLVVTFGPSAAVLVGPGKRSTARAALKRLVATGPLAPRDSGTGTRFHQASPMDAALALAEAEFEGHPTVRVTLLGDRSYSGADPGPRLRTWLARGFEFQVEEPPQDLADLALSGLIAPPRVFAGAPIGIGLDAFQLARHLAPGAPALRVRASFAGLSAQWFEPLLQSAENQHVQIDLGIGFREAIEAGARGEVHFEIDGGYLLGGNFEADAFRANDQVSGSVVVGDAARVLVAVREDQIQRAKSFFLGAGSGLSGVATSGLSYTFVGPDQVAAKLASADALISFDLSPDDLPAEQLKSFVESGGGWFAMGGWGLLADRNVHIGNGPRHLLPFGLDEDARLRDVILAVDGSGSMEGEPFEVVRRGALELVNGAPSTDEVRLVFFTDALSVESRIRPAFAGESTASLSGSELMKRAKEAESDLAVLMSTQVPGGNTSVLNAMRELVGMRLGASREALVLLLTDGQETRYRKNDPLELSQQRSKARRVSKDLAEVGARLVVIGVGAMEPGSDPDLFLHALLQPGESIVRCGLESGDEVLLGELLRKEVNRDRVWEGGFGVSRIGAEGSFEQQLLPLADGQNLPPVFRFGRFSLKPSAFLLAAGEGSKPLLAAARRQAGRTAALATLPGSLWAPEWTSAKSLEPLITWLADRPRDFGARVAVEAGAELVLEGMAEEGASASGFDIEIRPTILGQQGRFVPTMGGAALAKVRVSLLPSAPGPRALRFGAPVPAAVADALAAGAALEAQILSEDPFSADRILETLALVAPLDQGEGFPGRPRFSLGSSGHNPQGMVPSAGLRGPKSAPEQVPHPLAPWALGAGLALVFLGAIKAFGPAGR